MPWSVKDQTLAGLLPNYPNMETIQLKIIGLLLNMYCVMFSILLTIVYNLRKTQMVYFRLVIVIVTGLPLMKADEVQQATVLL